jgi:hypothetical protein
VTIKTWTSGTEHARIGGGKASINSRQFPRLGRAFQMDEATVHRCAVRQVKARLRGNTDRLPRAKPTMQLVHMPAGLRECAPKGSLSVERVEGHHLPRAQPADAQFRKSHTGRSDTSRGPSSWSRSSAT